MHKSHDTPGECSRLKIHTDMVLWFHLPVKLVFISRKYVNDWGNLEHNKILNWYDKMQVIGFRSKIQCSICSLKCSIFRICIISSSYICVDHSQDNGNGYLWRFVSTISMVIYWLWAIKYRNYTIGKAFGNNFKRNLSFQEPTSGMLQTH